MVVSIPDWIFPIIIGSSARHQSRPDAVFARSIPGQPAHLDPTKIPPQDRDIMWMIHLVESNFCPGTNPFPILEAATTQHANTKTRLNSSRNQTGTRRLPCTSL
eukprot:634535-Pelagomonas_calceolata.AAC.1